MKSGTGVMSNLISVKEKCVVASVSLILRLHTKNSTLNFLLKLNLLFYKKVLFYISQNLNNVKDKFELINI